MLSKEAEMSIAASARFPGFRFSPTDEELIHYYLTKKVEGFDRCVEVIPELDICSFEPWDLPAKSIIQSDTEWFFFSPRGKKYPNGSQSKRATEIGYWKATGKERAVKSGSCLIGTKRTLVFHIGRAPKGERTDWIMHEYCMAGRAQDSLVVCRLRRKSDVSSMDSHNEQVPSPDSLSMMKNRDYGRFGMDITGTSSTDKAGEKKSSSSYDSHSVEQMDSAESNRQFRDEILQPQSSSPHKHRGSDEDDCFAEILKDNIVDLDESSLTSTSAVPQRIAVRTPPSTYELPDQRHFLSQPQLHPSPQGTANRRIRLRKLRRSHSHKVDQQDQETRATDKLADETAWLNRQRGLMRLTRQGKKDLASMYVVVIGLIVLVVLFSLFGVVRHFSPSAFNASSALFSLIQCSTRIRPEI